MRKETAAQGQGTHLFNGLEAVAVIHGGHELLRQDVQHLALLHVQVCHLQLAQGLPRNVGGRGSIRDRSGAGSTALAGSMHANPTLLRNRAQALLGSASTSRAILCARVPCTPRFEAVPSPSI